jgi:hypothetical protein
MTHKEKVKKYGYTFAAIDNDVYKRLKLRARIEGKQINRILSEVVTRELDRRDENEANKKS